MENIYKSSIEYRVYSIESKQRKKERKVPKIKYSDKL